MPWHPVDSLPWPEQGATFFSQRDHYGAYTLLKQLVGRHIQVFGLAWGQFEEFFLIGREHINQRPKIIW